MTRNICSDASRQAQPHPLSSSRRDFLNRAGTATAAIAASAVTLPPLSCFGASSAHAAKNEAAGEPGCFSERFDGFSLTKFDGTTIVV
ncbi:MAG: twin-arginine translocation signal domain-containing protein [Pyrinomonadaceae bacterium]